MPAEHKIAIAGLAFLVIAGLHLILSVRRGRQLCRLFSQRLPEQYAELESPLPGYFTSPRRHAYFRFIMQRRFAALSDPELVTRFAQLRRSEMRQLVFLLAGFAGLAVAFVWLEWIRPAYL